MSTHKTNFFEFATKEISHSTFWAWLIAQLGRNKAHQKHIAKLLNDVFKPVNFEFSGEESWEVKTEYRLGKAGRIDVLAISNDKKKVFGIENKIKAQANLEQPKDYYDAMQKEWTEAACFLSFIDTGFDYEDAHDKIRQASFTLADISHLIETWQKNPDKQHFPFLVQEYFQWVEAKHYSLQQTKQILKTANPQKFVELAATSEGQYILMKWLADQQSHPLINPNVVHVKLPLTRNGLPTTEYWFYSHEPEGSYWQGLFFRLDAEPNGKLECTLRFYTETDDPENQRQKLMILDQLKYAVNELSGTKENTSPKRTKNSHRVCAVDIEKLSATKPDTHIAVLVRNCFSEMIEAVLPLMRQDISLAN